MLRFFLISIIYSALISSVAAQDTSVLVVRLDPSATLDLSDKGVITFYNDLERTQYLNEIISAYIQKGYLTANWEIANYTNDTATAVITPGRKVFWAKLNVEDTDNAILAGAGYRKKDFDGKVFSHTALLGIMQKMLNYSESHGYPFATVELNEIEWMDSTISASLAFKKNIFIEFDRIRVIGNLNVSANYLLQYTGITPGNAYNQKLLNDLDARLKAIPFATRTRPPSIEFSGNRATVLLYLDEKQSSTFDFLIGVLPNNEITGRLLITGEGKLQLSNVFNAGEQFNFHFSKLESTSKQLETALTYPYLPGIPLGLQGAFSLYLKDSTFLERKATAGIVYQFIGNNYLKAFVNFYNSNVLKVDTAFIITNKALPASLDLSERAYGLTWNYEKLDYKFNPRKGFAFTISSTIGTKIISENSNISELTDPLNPEFDFASLYDNIDLRSPSVKYNYDIRYFIPLLPQTTLLLQSRGAGVINNYLLQNELYRIGGNALLRGFDEQSILASQYHLATAELRYLLSQNAFAGLFFDLAYTENAAGTALTRDLPYGFGATVNFETKAGIFGLTYALGSQQQNPVQFKNTKIHFGYVNYF